MVTRKKLFSEGKEEEDEASCLMEEMRKNVEDVEHKKGMRQKKVFATLCVNTSTVTTEIRVVPGF